MAFYSFLSFLPLMFLKQVNNTPQCLQDLKGFEIKKKTQEQLLNPFQTFCLIFKQLPLDNQSCVNKRHNKNKKNQIYFRMEGRSNLDDKLVYLKYSIFSGLREILHNSFDNNSNWWIYIFYFKTAQSSLPSLKPWIVTSLDLSFQVCTRKIGLTKFQISLNFTDSMF